MRRQTKWILAVAVAAVLAGGTAWSLKAGDGDGPGRGRGAFGAGPAGGFGWAADPGLKEELGLTDEQTQQLRSLAHQNLKQRIRTDAELRIKRLELEELMEADAPDRAQIDKKLAELTSAQAAMTRMHVEHRLAFRSLLTPEQRSKLQQRMHQRMGRGMRDRGGRDGFGPRHHGPRREPGFGPGPDGGGPQDFDELLDDE